MLSFKLDYFSYGDLEILVIFVNYGRFYLQLFLSDYELIEIE